MMRNQTPLVREFILEICDFFFIELPKNFIMMGEEIAKEMNIVNS